MNNDFGNDVLFYSVNLRILYGSSLPLETIILHILISCKVSYSSVYTSEYKPNRDMVVIGFMSPTTTGMLVGTSSFRQA